MRQVEARTAPEDAAIDAARSAAPNAKAVVRAASRLRRATGVVRVTTRRQGSAIELACTDRYVAGVDRVRPAPSGRSVQAFQSVALAFRTTQLTFRKRSSPEQTTLSRVYLEMHAIARLIERGPFDPRSVDPEALALVLDRAQTTIRRSLGAVEMAVQQGLLDADLAGTFPVPCAMTEGLWVVEPSTSGEASCDGTVLTYIGTSSLGPEQHAFVTACGDGDLVGALTAYPRALKRTRADSNAAIGLARFVAAAHPLA